MDIQTYHEKLKQPELVTTRACPTCGMILSAKTAKCPQDGTELSGGGGAMELGSATLANKYEFVKQIGEGGMGSVFEVRHRIMNTPMAIKILHSDLSSPTGLKRFKREAQTAMQLRHPAIVAVHDFGVSEHETGDGLTLDYF